MADQRAVRAEVDPFVRALGEAIERRRNDPNTPRCAVVGCPGPSMMMVHVRTRYGDDIWIDVCEDHHDSIVWANNGYVPNIKKVCEGYDMRTGTLRDAPSGDSAPAEPVHVGPGPGPDRS